MTTTTLTATASPTPELRLFAIRRYMGDTLLDEAITIRARDRWQAARKLVTATSDCYLVMSDRREDDLTPGATRWTLTERRAPGLPAGSVTVVEVEEPATGTASQWNTAVANLRDRLQDAGMSPETTDDLEIRHEDGVTRLHDLTDGRNVMKVESPGALQDTADAMAWAYILGRHSGR